MSVVNDTEKSGLIYEVSETSKRLFDAEKLRKKREKRDQDRIKNELRGCTFIPKINSPGRYSRKAIPVGERLFNQAKQIVRSKNEMKQKKLQEEKKFLTFKPTINQKKMINDEKVFDRLSKVNKQEKLRELQKLKEARELDGCTFAPRLSKNAYNFDTRNVGEMDSLETSRSYSSLSRSGSNVFERLCFDKTLRQMKKADLKKQCLKEELKSCTFDARKTIDKIRKEQKEHQKQMNKERMEVQVNLRGKVKPPQSSLETGPSCFQQAINLVKFSAKTLSIPKKYEPLHLTETNQENCPALPNVSTN